MAAISTGAADVDGVDARGADADGVDADGDVPSHKLPIMLYSDPYNPRKLRFECIPITESVSVVLNTETPQALIKIPRNIVTKGNEFEPKMFDVGTSAKVVRIPGAVRCETLVLKLYPDIGNMQFDIYVSLLYVGEDTAIEASKILCTERVIQERRNYDKLQDALLIMEEAINSPHYSGLKNVTLLGLEIMSENYISDDLSEEKKEEARRFLEHWEEYKDLRNEEAKLIRGDESPGWGPRGFYADPNSVW